MIHAPVLKQPNELRVTFHNLFKKAKHSGIIFLTECPTLARFAIPDYTIDIYEKQNMTSSSAFASSDRYCLSCMLHGTCPRSP